jgi:hypothetical protein
MAAGCSTTDHAARNVSAPWADTAGVDSGLALAVRTATLEPGALATVPTAPVELWKGPGERPFDVAGRTSEREAGHARRFGTITLQTALRTRSLGQYPCTSCHLGRKMVLADKRIADAHDDIRPVHPKETGSVCSTCHAADNVALLQIKTGERVSLDQSYQLCARCHFQQVQAWAGGGHGKRLDGWQGRRVVMGCGDCHDPHRPALEPRIPFRPPQLEAARRSHP